MSFWTGKSGRAFCAATAIAVGAVGFVGGAAADGYGSSIKDAPVAASEDWAGHWLVRLRATYLMMEDDIDRAFVTPAGVPIPGEEANVSNQLIPELDISYFLTNNLAVEVICCATKHDVHAEGALLANVSGALDAFGYSHTGTELASTWAVPATVLLQYHQDLGNGFKPYLGAGPTYSLFLGEDVGGLLSGAASKVRVENTLGFTLQAGTDIAIGNNLFLNFDVKKMFLTPDVKWTINSGALAGQRLVAEELDLSPWIFSVGVGMKF